MLNRRTWGERTFDGSNALFMVLLSILTLYPFLYVAFASLSDPASLMQHRGLLLMPEGFSLDAYKAVFDNPMIPAGYRNTLFYVTAGTAINLFMTSLGAYVLSRKGLYFRNAMMFFIVLTMFFQGGLIPTYLLVSSLGMIDTPWAMLLPGAISTWNLIIMRTSFQAVPVSLEESARIDGANDWTILFRVIIPLSLPVIAVMILFYGVGHWNAWFGAMLYLRDRELYPLQLVLREILITNSTDNMTTGASSLDKIPIGETIKYATIIVATIPILLLYPFLQKYFVKGVMIGAIKE
ncbi:carbohydrate ABC transporter permease [Paenibacillus mucilaginosus]|uniref:Binding-protein-dependent transport systems inner membrane component n=3 Tax=Paenibacillus mucilaginosus TaxID=61624 RepID=H6NB62_9BACL|nr:carbohydrate ABC transporter permease [Paenibacillus mucilaginosus]AEI42487.1 binding-protein-dependent transport systems inner membrane component [Paenibacillus mucilaginosus KNP414]AFC32030.1 binding-protein-dependent transport systems inner membrane component [Paenibacillus mucilaginosus 3016]AFH64399.1 sugar ABC transporter permease [Paenibacillus mucilaginosus K02]MCG7213881.1 carbohydrate ABC transporter permease [Paenibacillus mucilaginosus]WDM25887.1 carbohydrate ABC transporter per